MSDVTPPQAGWYKDPENPAGERWWNGSGWSDQKRAATTAAAPAAASVTAPTGFSYGNPAAAGRPDPYAAPSYAAGSPYVAAPYGAPAYGPRANALAIAGLIVSAGGWIVFPFVAPLVGIILSAFGLGRAKQAEAAGNPNSGRGMALAGLIIGIVLTALGALFIVLYGAFVVSTMGTTY